MADDDPVEYEKKLLANYPLLDNKPLPHTIRIPVSQRVKSIRTRDELTTMPSRKDTPGPYTVGDLLWVKMSGYPHWPAMISRDPENGVFSRSSETVGFTYHVQYFGEATRGWTQPGKFWPFEGPQLIIGNRNVLPKQKKKQYEEAISEAVQAQKLEPASRVKKLTFNYLLTDPKASLTPKAPRTPGRKRKTPSKTKSSANDDSIYDFDETVDEIELGDKPELVWSRPREPTPPREPSPPRSKYLADDNDDDDAQEEEDEIRLRTNNANDELDNENHDEQHNSTDNDETIQQETENVLADDNEISNGKETKPSKEIPEPRGRGTRRSTVIVRNNSIPLASAPSADEDDGEADEEEIEQQQEEKPQQKRTPNTRERRVKSTPRREMSPINNNNSPSRPVKKLRGSSIVKRPPPPPADAMTSSEDASSTSDLEAPDVRLDKLCNICHEESGTFYFCSGTCLRTMHASCGGSESTNNNSDKFICQECKTGKHPCFICKSVEGDCVKCCHKNCGKYYHLACLNPSSYPASIKSGNTFTCPMHYCLTCYTEQPFPRDINCLKPTKRQLLKCLSCPTAFHNDDSCTAAGTVVLAGSYVMCPAHRSTKNDKHINVSWCFSCNEGGKLICCESCPAAFHDECIDNPPKTNDEQYFCYDCQSRKQLKYGDIIWIKLGAYRWWPAKISHPHTVPENIMKLSHTRGDFPVYFFGSHDYYWSHRGRVFVFVEEDGQLKGKSGSSDKKFKVAVQEARQEYLQRKAKEDERKEKMKSMEKPRFRLIKSNKPINDVAQSSQDDIKMSSKQRCECKPDGEVQCGTDECLNRLMMLECDPSTCPVKEKCKNQRFRKRQYPVCVPFRTENVGWGLRTTQDIKKGDFVIEYVGELIDEAECNRRMEEKMERGDTTFYFLTIDKERIIDAGPAANHARFMNHSCQPNCETQKWVVNGQTKVGLFAICDIPAGYELTFNYNLDCRGNEKMQCRCNSENCSGYIGLPVKNVKKPTSTVPAT